MARTKSIFSEKCESSLKSAKSYRNLAKQYADETQVWRKLEAFHKLNNFPLPTTTYEMRYAWNGYELSYKDDSVRSILGQVFGITKWDRSVDSYSGTVELTAEVETIIGKIRFVLKGASLAPGCRLETYSESVTRYRSVCDNES